MLTEGELRREDISINELPCDLLIRMMISLSLTQASFSLLLEGKPALASLVDPC